MRDAQQAAETLLDWYDTHARDLPWRLPPGVAQAPDPYHVWLSEVMLQQTTVPAVRGYFAKFLQRWPRVEDLAAAEDAEVMAAWAGLGYYARARNLLKCARLVAQDLGGRFPDTEEGLRELPGVGPYTSAAIAAIAFDRATTVLDANVERVMARVYAVTKPLPDCKEDLRALAAALTPVSRPGDYAQAVMDLGATICTVRNPTCGLCPWRAECSARAEGIAEQLPRKRPKAPKPVRRGIVYFARRSDGALLMETRPATGLLGGMLALPTTDWTEAGGQDDPPVQGDWNDRGEVRHTFTHFHLALAVRVATNITAPPRRGRWVPVERADPSHLPTVFRKAFQIAAGGLAPVHE